MTYLVLYELYVAIDAVTILAIAPNNPGKPWTANTPLVSCSFNLFSNFGLKENGKGTLVICR